MENTAWEYGQSKPVAPLASMNARHLNEDVKNGMAARVWPIDGDASNRELAEVMVREIQTIVGVELLPFQRTYLNAVMGTNHWLTTQRRRKQ